MFILKVQLGLILILSMLFQSALAEYNAQSAQAWLEQFAQKLSEVNAINDVQSTADPARAGEYVLEFDFGVVTARHPSQPSAGEILRVELKTDAVEDCRGIRVGQTLEDVIAGRQIASSDTPLYVLQTQDSGYGWSWAYVDDGDVYGVEYISYSSDETVMKEYTLTYVLDDDRITAIRMQIADATLAQAKEGLNTAEEIAGRQRGEVLIYEHGGDIFSAQDMAIMGRTIVGAPVEKLIALLGEPMEIQALPDGLGRMLVYEECVAELIFDEMTGVERIRSVSCASEKVPGPSGLRVGMSIEEAAAFWRCDGDVYSFGGILYLAGEAQGVAPYGELRRDGVAAYTLCYACEMENGMTGVLDIGVADGAVTHWHMHMGTTEADYGG